MHRLDILVAVAFPTTIAVYCMSTFSIDRRLMAINLEVFPPGFFEREVSAISDPVQPKTTRNALGSLRVISVLSVFTRVGTNLALCWRFYQLADRITNPNKWNCAIYPKKRPVAVVFVLIAVAAVALAELSIRTSSAACRPHPECVQHAWRWTTPHDGDLSQCPCLTIVDVDTRLKTYDEWLNPPDAADKVAQLSAPGYLQTINLINRQLPVIPSSCAGARTSSVCTWARS